MARTINRRRLKSQFKSSRAAWTDIAKKTGIRENPYRPPQTYTDALLVGCDQEMTLARSNPRAIERSQVGNADYVPHLSIDHVRELAAAAALEARNGKGDRDALLIQTMFDGCFRVSEAIQITPACLHRAGDGWAAWIVGKGRKLAEVALSASLVSELHAYAYQHNVKPEERLFPIDRTWVFRIMDRAFKSTGIVKPPGVGACHVLRHSGAIARLAATGNPKALQDHLRHQDARMTLRYLKTLSTKESLAIQQAVDLGW